MTISAGEQEDVILKGACYRQANAFSKELKDAWVRFNLAALEKEAARLDRIIAGVLSLTAPDRYPAACTVTPLLDDARALDASLLSKLNTTAIGP